MSTLARRSALVLGLLFGLLFAVGTAVMYRLEAPVWLAVLFALAVVGLQYALGPWIIEQVYKIRWVEPESIHPEFARWYRETCAQRGLPVPRLGVIDDGNPNAFTFGHHTRDARVVVTSGLLQLLTPAEVHAVVAHELGHVRNLDFVVMTLASAVPLVLYMLYVFCRRGRRDRNGGYTFLVAVGAYAAYVLSQYIVLLLSRIREYFADEQSAAMTRDPNALASALVKISYGLAVQEAQQTPPATNDAKGKKEPALDLRGATAVLGIASVRGASHFAMAAVDGAGAFSVPVMTRAMQWDLKNPWAKWFELHATHPLTARRIGAMNGIARKLGLAPAYDLSGPEFRGQAYTGNLWLEIGVAFLPAAAGLAGLIVGGALAWQTHWWGLFGLALAGYGAGWFAQMLYAYPQTDPATVRGLRSVESLVGEVNVCHVTAVPCMLEGQIVGRGVPGLFWSKDLVLRDHTGFLRLQYRQPFGFLELLFGCLSAARFVGRSARVYGWYRRAPVPYVEIQRVEMLDGPDGIRCYYLLANRILAGLIAAGGLALIALLR